MTSRTSENPGDSDENLAERVRATGDQAAFALLVGRYRSRIIALARRIVPTERAEAEDIAQEAFVAAYDKRATFRQGCPFRPWLYRIAINRCLDRQRAQKRNPPPIPIESIPEPEKLRAGPLDSLLADERNERLQEAIDALPVQYRTVLLLRHLDDLPYEEIALAMDMPLGTIKTHLFRARALLRQALAGYMQEL